MNQLGLGVKDLKILYPYNGEMIWHHPWENHCGLKNAGSVTLIVETVAGLSTDLQSGNITTKIRKKLTEISHS